MKVKELLKFLKKVDPEADIKLSDGLQLLDVIYVKYTDTVYLTDDKIKEDL